MPVQGDNVTRLRVLLLGLALFSLPALAGGACDKPWIYFDLGLNTLVDTSHEDPTTHDLVEVYYMPGANEYLEKLRELGYHLGLLVDVPEEWGASNEEMFTATKAYFASGWAPKDGAHALDMDWSRFANDAVFFPPKNKFRKASNSLYLFKKGIEAAAAFGCKAIYQATKKKEIVLAKLAGMKGYQVGVEGQSYYLPVEQIQELGK